MTVFYISTNCIKSKFYKVYLINSYWVRTYEKVKVLCYEANSKGGKKIEQELAYSFHLGSDKKSKVAKKTAKGNVSGITSFSNNAIQNANDLSAKEKIITKLKEEREMQLNG